MRSVFERARNHQMTTTDLRLDAPDLPATLPADANDVSGWTVRGPIVSAVPSWVVDPATIAGGIDAAQFRPWAGVARLRALA